MEGGDVMADIVDLAGDIVGGAFDAVGDVGSSLDDFVNENIPGGWLLPAAAVAAPYLAPELLAGDAALEVAANEALAAGDLYAGNTLAEVLAGDAMAPGLLDTTGALDAASKEAIAASDLYAGNTLTDVLSGPGLLDNVTGKDILNTARVVNLASGLLGAGAAAGAINGDSGGFPIIPIPSDWKSPVYEQYKPPIYKAFGPENLLAGSQWDSALNHRLPTAAPVATGMNYSDLMENLGAHGAPSINDIISGIQSQYG